jgi:hypothetical protein
MDINKKLEEIREKPDEIRKRYVWAAVIICMLFVVIIWIFSTKESLKSVQQKESVLPELPNISEQMKNLNAQLPTLEDSISNLPADQATTDTTTANTGGQAADSPNSDLKK